MKELNEALLMRTSKAKDGDLLVLKDDTIDYEQFRNLREVICKVTGKKLALLVLPTNSDITLIEADEARSILERIAARKE